MLPPKRVLLVDDLHILRDAIATLLRADPLYEIIGDASDGPTAVLMAEKLRPDVILLDVDMPGGFDGIEATRQIRAASAAYAPVIVVMSAGDHKSAAIAAGADVFLSKLKVTKLRHCLAEAEATRPPAA